MGGGEDGGGRVWEGGWGREVEIYNVFAIKFLLLFFSSILLLSFFHLIPMSGITNHFKIYPLSYVN